MKRTFKKRTDFYPYVRVGKTNINIRFHLNVIFSYLLDYETNKKDSRSWKSFRESSNAIYGYLEEMHGYFFGESQEFQEMKRKDPNFNDYVKNGEHKIPLRVFVQKMIDNKILTIGEIYDFYANNYCMYHITSKENNRLNNLGLRDKEPEDGSDRYEAAGIIIARPCGKSL